MTTEELNEQQQSVNLSFLREGFVIGRKHDGELWFSYLGEQERPDLIVMLGLAQTAVDFIRHCRDLNFPSLRQDLLYLASQIEVNQDTDQQDKVEDEEEDYWEPDEETKAANKVLLQRMSQLLEAMAEEILAKEREERQQGAARQDKKTTS